MQPAPRGPSAAHATQLERIRAEMQYLVSTVADAASATDPLRHRLRDEAAYWSGETPPLIDTVRRAFEARQLLMQAAGCHGTWRNSVSYIGSPPPEDARVCTYDYDRAEVRFDKGSALAKPYAWACDGDLEVETWYMRNGMCAIVAWMCAVARMAVDAPGPVSVFTNRLYHETDMLFDMARFHGVTVERHDSVSDILAAAATHRGPVAVFLDSSRAEGDVVAVRSVLAGLDPDRVGCVVWDNTCAPADHDPFESTLEHADLHISLLLLRSHVKLDQLGLEFCTLASIAMLTGRAITDEGRRFRDGMRAFLSDAITVTGACASPASLRLLASLGLPNRPLAKHANACLRAANVLAGTVLRAEMQHDDRYHIEEAAHRCFVEIHLDEIPAPPAIGGPESWPVWDELDAELDLVEERAARRSVPVWKSASFGFHYTGLSWYASEAPPRPLGYPHTVLRVCFGMHDSVVVGETARSIARQLIQKHKWLVPA